LKVILIKNMVPKVANGFVFVTRVASLMIIDKISENPVINVTVTMESSFEIFFTIITNINHDLIMRDTLCVYHYHA
jgi:hypothetical protein